jgi:signal recognition particle receptor subunit alpha
VLVVECDTFRADAIEQLKTHVMALKSLYERGRNAPIKIELSEKGYGRDSAAIAMEAINYARNNEFNCMIVDTAGRMPDNEPLMSQLAKLIKINTPDITLLVGEALVGNEAVDQLNKFNKSLLDCGFRVTRFDTIDDQVGAAIDDICHRSASCVCWADLSGLETTGRKSCDLGFDALGKTT